MNALAFLSLLGTANALLCNTGITFCSLDSCSDDTKEAAKSAGYKLGLEPTECLDGEHTCYTLSYSSMVDGCELGIAEGGCGKAGLATEDVCSDRSINGIDETDCAACTTDSCNPDAFVGDTCSPASSLRAAFVPRIIKALLTTLRLL